MYGSLGFTPIVVEGLDFMRRLPEPVHAAAATSGGERGQLSFFLAVVPQLLSLMRRFGPDEYVAVATDSFLANDGRDAGRACE
jgi:hypothetical protein